MAWEFADEVEPYATRVWELLADRPAENTVALTVIENLRAGYRWSPAPMLLGWYRSGSATSGAISMTPPHELLLAEVPACAIGPLVTALRTRGVRVPGVSGDTATTDAFAAAWTSGGPQQAITTMRQRLYRLETLRSPQPPPPGHPRLAGEDDVGLAVDWFTRFQAEAGAQAVDAGAVVRDRLDHGLLWLWQDGDGRVVSLAARNRTAAGVARVGPVYTPPERRRHGYGAAVTAACTLDALRRDADHVVLFTDLANPTSNAVYQRLGYSPVRDHQVIRFEQPPSGPR